MAPALAWAYAYVAAYEADPERYSRYQIPRRAEYWLAQELLRMEVALLGAETPDDGGDRLLRALKALETLGPAEGDFRRDSAHLGDAAQHWIARAPAACDDLVTHLATHTHGNVRYAIARAAPTDRPAGLAALTNLARDGSDTVKKVALERLRSTRDVSFWQSAFSTDPFAQQSPGALTRLRDPVKVICDSFAPRATRPSKQALQKHGEHYTSALAALPDRLLLDHARTVLARNGRSHALSPFTLHALGERPNTIDAVLTLVESWGTDCDSTDALVNYFRAAVRTSAPNRVRCVLTLTRWAHQQERNGDDDELRLWSLLHDAQLESLWPAKRSLRPWVALLEELAASHDSTAIEESMKAIGTKRLPRDLRAKMLHRWVTGDDGDEGHQFALAAHFNHREAAALLPPRALRDLVDKTLALRRSAEAMRWALELRIGALHVPRRDGPLEVLLGRLYADPGLRAVVLTSGTLSSRFVAWVRPDLVAGRITEAQALMNAVEAVQECSGDAVWFLRSHEAQWHLMESLKPRAEALALSEAEWDVVRDLRPAALAAGTQPCTHAVELFPKTPWNDRDRADFVTLTNQHLGGGRRSDDDPDDDLDLLGFVLDQQWHPSLAPLAQTLVAALQDHPGSNAPSVRNALLARLGT